MALQQAFVQTKITLLMPLVVGVLESEDMEAELPLLKGAGASIFLAAFRASAHVDSWLQ